MSEWVFYIENGRGWAEPAGECPVCVAMFLHRHSVRPDGSLGNAMECVSRLCWQIDCIGGGEP